MKRIIVSILLFSVLLCGCAAPNVNPVNDGESTELTEDEYVVWNLGVEKAKENGVKNVITYEDLRKNEYNEKPVKPSKVVVKYYGVDIEASLWGKESLVPITELYEQYIYKTEEGLYFYYDSRGVLVSYSISKADPIELEQKYIGDTFELSKDECFEKGKVFLKSMSIELNNYTLNETIEKENGYSFSFIKKIGDLTSDERVSFFVRKSGFVTGFSSERIQTIADADENPFDLNEAHKKILDYIEKEFIPDNFYSKFDKWTIEKEEWSFTMHPNGELALQYTCTLVYVRETGNITSACVFYVTD